MPQYFAIMLNYAQVWWESYYAQNNAGIMCQALIGRQHNKAGVYLGRGERGHSSPLVSISPPP